MRKLILITVTTALLAGVSFAANAPKRQPYQPKSPARIGIGFDSQLSNAGMQSLALRYWLSEDMAAEGFLGFAFGDNKIFDLGGIFISVIKKEQNLNFYALGLIGMENTTTKVTSTAVTASGITTTTEDKSETALTVGGGLGIEFFLSGLPNLGFGAEFGVGYNSSTKLFGTIGHWLSSVGIRYYYQ
ncbi:MAG: hypothetical protein A2386_00985 [Elusimicrobia bacterium RIFOXYB1_FULL_48_9]|nr:MAG: hypothetical protein A2386_00985 [Elusimicrobia bacterium RIFOXYB1_FULL_48_9]